MSAGLAPGSAALRSRAAEARGRAAGLREQAAAQRRRADELCDRVVQTLLQSPAQPLGGRGTRFELRLARLRPLVRFGRQQLREWMQERDLPAEVITDVTLAFSEAYANAVEHPGSATRQLVEVAARTENGQLQLRVRDFGTWSSHARSEQRGRGLPLIRQLMDSLDVQQRADGTELLMCRSL